MTDPMTVSAGGLPANRARSSGGTGGSANLADILERVLDKGIVIAGDIQINLLDIELLTIKLRLLVASVDKAKEMGIDWWEHDPSLTSRPSGKSPAQLADENEQLRERIERLENGDSSAELPPGENGNGESVAARSTASSRHRNP